MPVHSIFSGSASLRRCGRSESFTLDHGREGLFEGPGSFVIVLPARNRRGARPALGFPRDMEVVMLRWPIRLKLIVGFSVVVGMMLILMGASIFGLHSFHLSYLTLIDQLREIGASSEPVRLGCSAACPARRDRRRRSARAEGQVLEAQRGAAGLLPSAEEEHEPGEPGRQRHWTSWGWRFLIDDDLAAILNELDPDQPPRERLFPGYHVELIPSCCRKSRPATGLQSRIERLNETVMQLPKRLYEDFWAVLQMSQGPVPHEPDHRVVVGGDGAGDALRADAPVPPVGALARRGCCSGASATWRAARSTTRLT